MAGVDMERLERICLEMGRSMHLSDTGRSPFIIENRLGCELFCFPGHHYHIKRKKKARKRKMDRWGG